MPSEVKSIVVCPSGASQALTKIIFDLKEVGKTETTYKEKTHDTLKLYLVEQYSLLVVHMEPALKGQFANQLVDLVFG